MSLMSLPFGPVETNLLPAFRGTTKTQLFSSADLGRNGVVNIPTVKRTMCEVNVATKLQLQRNTIRQIGAIVTGLDLQARL